jgi:hypothetical protein
MADQRRHHPLRVDRVLVTTKSHQSNAWAIFVALGVELMAYRSDVRGHTRSDGVR